MGIDFTYKGRADIQDDTPHWAYSGFNRFRKRIADALGIDLYSMKGFAPHMMEDAQQLEWNKTAKDWSIVKSPIKYFLNHSDCDGQISAKRCKKIGEIIYSIVSEWEDGDYDKQEGILLAKTMQNCYKNNVPLIFT